MAPMRADPTLGYYAAFARRHVWRIIVLTVMGSGIGLTQSLLTPPTYTASTQVFAPATPVHPGVEREPGQRLPRDVTVDTEAQLLRSGPVLDRVAGALGVSRTTAGASIMVTVPANTRVLSVQVRHQSPQRALAGVVVATDTYLSLRQQIVAGVRQRQLEALQSRIGVLETRLATMSKGVIARGGSGRTQRAALIRQINDMERQVSTLQRQGDSPGEIVRAASVPKQPDRRNNEVPVVSYAAAGLLIAIGLGARRDSTRHQASLPDPLPEAERHDTDLEPKAPARLGRSGHPRPAGPAREGA